MGNGGVFVWCLRWWLTAVVSCIGYEEGGEGVKVGLGKEWRNIRSCHVGGICILRFKVSNPILFHL